MDGRVMQYDEDRLENAQGYCALCDAVIDPAGLAIAAGGEDFSGIPGHCENCGAAEDHPDSDADKPIDFLARFCDADPIACLCTLMAIQNPAAPCRWIAARTGISKTVINAAQMRAGQYIDGLEGVVGRKTAAAIAQRARRAAEGIEEQAKCRQMVLL